MMLLSIAFATFFLVLTQPTIMQQQSASAQVDILPGTDLKESDLSSQLDGLDDSNSSDGDDIEELDPAACH